LASRHQDHGTAVHDQRPRETAGVDYVTELHIRVPNAAAIYGALDVVTGNRVTYAMVQEADPGGGMTNHRAGAYSAIVGPHQGSKSDRRDESGVGISSVPEGINCHPAKESRARTIKNKKGLHDIEIPSTNASPRGKAGINRGQKNGKLRQGIGNLSRVRISRMGIPASWERPPCG
jgi:hypothetical protein